MAKENTMSVENRIYPNFKSYGQYQKNARSQKQQEAIANKRSLNPVLGAAIGVASAAIISPKVFKTQKTFDEVGKCFQWQALQILEQF